jgi:short-subunit dehydrogenase
MLSRGEGRIVNISSLAGIVTTPHLAAYSATKAFVTQLSAGLSLELRGTPVACTKVEIGETRDTGQSDNVRKDPVVAAIFERLYRLHLSRQLSPEEVTHAVLRAVRYGLPSVQLPRRVAPAARLADALRMSTSYATRGATTTDATTELTAPR